MHVYRRTEIHLDPDDRFDIEVDAQFSNQHAKSGRFTMQVREIDVNELLSIGQDSVHIVGHRYKADGSLGSTRAAATVEPAELPSSVRKMIRPFLPRSR